MTEKVPANRVVRVMLTCENAHTKEICTAIDEDGETFIMPPDLPDCPVCGAGWAQGKTQPIEVEDANH